MSSASKPKVIAVLGPTASGKSDLAVRLARRFNGEVISADSRQVYRGLDIGTGKISPREMRGVPHHLLDVVSPRRIFTVAQYQKLAGRQLEGILKRGRLPVVAGGTGFYLDALLHGYKLPEVRPDPLLRRKLAGKTAEELLAELKKLDPARAATVDPHNKVRLIRAIEIVRTTGGPVPKLGRSSDYEILKIGLRLPKAELEQRIRARLFRRMRQGMVAEVERLRRQGLSWRRLDELGLEYRYVSLYLRGLMDKVEMAARLEKEIRQYAKRQMTWWNRDEEIRWISETDEAERLVRDFLEKRSSARSLARNGR